MTFSLLQLNINADNFWDKLIPYLTSHDFDVIQLQEVFGENSRCGIVNCKRDCFADLQKTLGDRYNGELAITDRFTSSPMSYIGVATFYRKSFQLEKKYILQMYQHKNRFPSDAKSFEDVGRALLHLQLNINGKTISFLNTHFAWTKKPIEEPHQTKQSKILLDYLKKIPTPFIVTGDFNLTPDQPLIQKINILAHNLTTEYQITNTLNPRKHYVKSLFPKGLAVDYIFTSRDLTVKQFEVLKTEDISDHFGLTATIQL